MILLTPRLNSPIKPLYKKRLWIPTDDCPVRPKDPTTRIHPRGPERASEEKFLETPLLQSPKMIGNKSNALQKVTPVSQKLTHPTSPRRSRQTHQGLSASKGLGPSGLTTASSYLQWLLFSYQVMKIVQVQVKCLLIFQLQNLILINPV
jgi:hypothetical protein